LSYALLNEPDLPSATRLQAAEKQLDVTLEIKLGPWTGKSIRVPVGRSVKVGRSDQSDIALASDAYISRIHFSLDWDGAAWWIKDLNSRHGTFVNEQRVEKSSLHDGDMIRVGFTVMAVRLVAHDPAALVNSAKDADPTTSRARANSEPTTAETLQPDLSARPAKS
jgi:pSer/pThr/pTyr-binding forkhead associated (FHA) protein